MEGGPESPLPSGSRKREVVSIQSYLSRNSLHQEIVLSYDPHVSTVHTRNIVVYYESRKRELKIRLMNEVRCDERLKARVEESTCLIYTGLHDKTS